MKTGVLIFSNDLFYILWTRFFQSAPFLHIRLFFSKNKITGRRLEIQKIQQKEGFKVASNALQVLS